MNDDAPDISLLAEQQRRIISDVGSIKADLAELTAIAMRQDNTLVALLTETRAMHAQHSQLANRVRDLEVRDGEPEVRDAEA